MTSFKPRSSRRAIASAAFVVSASLAGFTAPAITGTVVAQAQTQDLGTQTFACGEPMTVDLPQVVQLVDNVQVSGLPTGVTFSGSKPYTIGGTPTVAGTYNISATGSAPLVGNVTATGTLVITPCTTTTPPTTTPIVTTAPVTTTPVASTTPVTTTTPEPTSADLSTPGSSSSEGSSVGPIALVGAAALGSAALSSGGSSEKEAVAPAVEVTPTPEAPVQNAEKVAALTKGIDPQAAAPAAEKPAAPDAAPAAEKGFAPNAAPNAAPKVAPKVAKPAAQKQQRGMLAATGVEFPTAQLASVLALMIAGAAVALRRRNS